MRRRQLRRWGGGDWRGWVMWQGCLTIGSPSLCSSVGCPRLVPAVAPVEGGKMWCEDLKDIDVDESE